MVSIRYVVVYCKPICLGVFFLFQLNIFCDVTHNMYILENYVDVLVGCLQCLQANCIGS